jgi:hypothetical protein
MTEKRNVFLMPLLLVAAFFSLIVWPIICLVYVIKVSEIYISSGLIGKMIEVYLALMSIFFIAHSLLLSPKPLTDIQRRQEELFRTSQDYQRKITKELSLNDYVYVCFALSFYLLVLNVILYFAPHTGNLIFYEIASWFTISPLFGYFLLLFLTIHVFHQELLKSKFNIP